MSQSLAFGEGYKNRGCILVLQNAPPLAHLQQIQIFSCTDEETKRLHHKAVSCWRRQDMTNTAARFFGSPLQERLASLECEKRRTRIYIRMWYSSKRTRKRAGRVGNFHTRRVIFPVVMVTKNDEKKQTYKDFAYVGGRVASMHRDKRERNTPPHTQTTRPWGMFSGA